MERAVSASTLKGSDGSAASSDEPFSQIKIAIKDWLSPQITTSLAMGASAATSCARRVPAETQVPVINLNCSAMRPANRSPASGLSGSRKSHCITHFEKTFLVKRLSGFLWII